MTIDHVVEFIIEAMHEDLAGRGTLGVRLVQNFPTLPATQLSAAFSAAADAIEEMFEHEGHPTDQANRARPLPPKWPGTPRALAPTPPMWPHWASYGPPVRARFPQRGIRPQRQRLRGLRGCCRRKVRGWSPTRP